MTELINNIKQAIPFKEIIELIVIFLGGQVAFFIKNLLSEQKQKRIEKVVKDSVIYIEQITGLDVIYEGKEKFEMAKTSALEKLNDLGLTISDTYLDKLIEVFVHEINNNRLKEIE